MKPEGEEKVQRVHPIISPKAKEEERRNEMKLPSEKVEHNGRVRSGIMFVPGGCYFVVSCYGWRWWCR